MQDMFDRAYYEASLARNLKLADEALIPHIREAHLRLAEFYRVALGAVAAIEQAGPGQAAENKVTAVAAVA
jgi:hypothetical protein